MLMMLDEKPQFENPYSILTIQAFNNDFGFPVFSQIESDFLEWFFVF